MQDSQTPERPTGQTSGTAQRPPHELSGPVTVLNFAEEAEALRREPAWQHGDRNAKTFVKEADLRVLLTVLKRGAVLREHRVPGTATVQTLSGRIRLRVPDRSIELLAGQTVILERDLPHDVEALEESVFLVAVAWSGEVRGDTARR